MHRIIQEFRDGLQRGELLMQKCNACGKVNLYPRYACPFCQSEDLGWQAASGAGTLHSLAIQRLGAPIGFEEQLPYALGVVKLKEGPQLLGRLHPTGEEDWTGYSCDAAVSFTPHEDPRGVAWFKLS
jgi:uncharacterized OB-fold protein